MFEQPLSSTHPKKLIGLGRTVAIPLAMVFFLAHRPASAQEDLYESLNLAERRSVDRALEELGLEGDPAPQGKRFGRLIVVNQEVFWEDLPALTWLNWFHSTTRPDVIRQEILWCQGDLYDPELVWESARNLRQRNSLSVVAMVPVESDRPDQVVDILAVTRDTWSLRLGFQLDMTDDVIDHLQVSLTDWNVAGLHKLVSLITVYQQDTLTIGPTYVDPRLFGTRLSLWEGFGLVINHDTGEVEGSTNLLQFELPLFRRDARWGFRYLEQHDISIDRYFIGPALRTYDNPDTAEVEAIPFEIEQKEVDVLGEVVHGLGSMNKHLFSLGYGLSIQRYDLADGDLDPDTREAFATDVLPIGELASYIGLAYRFYRTEYASTRNYQTFGFSEDLRVGHDVIWATHLASRAFGSDSDFIRSALTGGFNLLAAGMVLQSEIELGGRWELQGDELFDRYISGLVHFASPMWGPIRIHVGGDGLIRFNREFASLQSTGGGDGLRGFPSGAFLGESRVLGHLELRTHPIEWMTVFWGLVAFFDLGTVFDEGDTPEWLADVGLGIRAVIPQLQRIPWRLDYACPVSGPYGFFPGVLTLGTDQVF